MGDAGCISSAIVPTSGSKVRKASACMGVSTGIGSHRALRVVGDPFFSTPDVFVSFGHRAEWWKGRDTGKIIVSNLVVDGKQKAAGQPVHCRDVVFSRGQGLSAEATWMPTRARRSRSYTLVDEESADNMVQIFETATGLAEKDAGLNLRKQVVQVHKDYAKGMDPARRRVFPWARPCDDYAHMHRASYKNSGEPHACFPRSRQGADRQSEGSLQVHEPVDHSHPLVAHAEPLRCGLADGVPVVGTRGTRPIRGALEDNIF